MATKGLQRLARRAVLARLKANVTLTALVPAARILPDAATAPEWPFIKTGATRTLPRRGSGYEGGEIAIDLHAFARPREVAGEVVETAEDYAGRIGAAIEEALDDAWITLEGSIPGKLRLTDLQLLQDDEPGAFHWFAQVNVRAMAPTA